MSRKPAAAQTKVLHAEFLGFADDLHAGQPSRSPSRPSFSERPVYRNVYAPPAPRRAYGTRSIARPKSAPLPVGMLCGLAVALIGISGFYATNAAHGEPRDRTEIASK